MDRSKVEVLDAGFIRLVDHMGGDLSIVRAARVSHDADWREHGEKNDNRLINYLWTHRHTTPFEAVTMTFEIKAPILVFRQWHRHRTQSYNEVSARYTELDMGWYVPAAGTIEGPLHPRWAGGSSNTARSRVSSCREISGSPGEGQLPEKNRLPAAPEAPACTCPAGPKNLGWIPTRGPPPESD